MLIRLALLLLLAIIPADARTLMHGGSVVSGGGGYTGPGDIQSFTVWFGLRAYNAAYATGSNAAANVYRLADGHNCDFLVTTSGTIGNTANCSTGGDNGQSATAFAGTDVSGTGSISGTTLTLTGGTIGDEITGGTTAKGTFIVSGSSPTWTVNISQTVSSATLTASNALIVFELYNQTGSGGAATNGGLTVALNPVYLSHCVCMGAAGTSVNLAYATSVTFTSPYTFYLVGERTGNFTVAMAAIIPNTGNFQQVGWSNAANTARMYAGTVVTATASDSAMHFLLAVLGTSGVINVDGTETAGNSGTFAGSGAIRIIGDGSGNGMIGLSEEFGVLNSGTVSSGNRASLRSNVSAFWGTP